MVKLQRVCRVCLWPLALDTGEFCSERCEQGEIALDDLTAEISSWKKTPDDRIFYLDFGFGKVCDRYCVLVLRRLHQKRLSDQLETDFHIGRTKMALVTKINRLSSTHETRTKLSSLIARLFNVNAQMWRHRSWALDGRLDLDTRMKSAIEYLEVGTNERDRLRAELDMVVEGRPRNERV